MPSVLSDSIQTVFSLVETPLHAVKESLLGIIPPDSALLAETVQYSLTGGGKYLRPAMTLLSGIATKTQSAQEQQHLIEVAAVAEMIHVATLLHDDVLDHAALRRGKATVSSQWGNKISVLSGDYLLAQASLKLSKLGQVRLVGIFAQVLADLCDGEVEQMHTSFALKPSWESYYKKTVCKTASLFSAGCEAAGVVNALPEPQIQALKTYGHHFGIAFQIMDDLLDYTATEAEMGKPVLDDLRNGLMTAPILLALTSEQLPSAERQALLADVESLFQQPNEATIARIQAHLQASEALEETRALAQRYITEAKQAIHFVPDSREKQALLFLADYTLSRKH